MTDFNDISLESVSSSILSHVGMLASLSGSPAFEKAMQSLKAIENLGDQLGGLEAALKDEALSAEDLQAIMQEELERLKLVGEAQLIGAQIMVLVEVEKVLKSLVSTLIR